MMDEAADISDLLGSDLEDIDDRVSEWGMESEESEESTSDEDEDGEIRRAAVTSFRPHSSLPQRCSPAGLRGASSRVAPPANERIIQWTRCDDFVPTLPVFDAVSVGITDHFPEVNQECDYFLAYLSDDLLDLIVAETNMYYAKCDAANEVTHSHQTKQWTDVTRDDLMVFIALTLLMPHGRRAVRYDFWRRNDILFTPVFAKYMARDRYTSVLRFLHFASIENDDPLRKIRPVLQHLLNKFKTFFKPFQKIVVDESLMLFKGRLKFKQYIPSKRHRFGIKIYVLCDCETGIVLNMCLHTGTDINGVTRNHPLGFSGSVVDQLIKDYLDRGHILYTDNWYTSPDLAMYLHEHNTGAVGTVKPNRKKMPKFEATKKGDIIRYRTNDMTAIKWHDKREVHLLSTVHTGRMLTTGKIHCQTRKPILKPDVIIDYNTNMRLIDKADMQLNAVDTLRKNDKWYKKVFFHLLDICMLNAYKMYMTKTGDRSSRRAFRKNAIEGLLERFGKEISMHSRTGRQSHAASQSEERLSAPGIAVHYPAPVPSPPGKPNKKGQRECIVCKTTEIREKKRKLVTTMCNGCNVALCLGDCFRQYHTLKTF